MRAHIPSFTRAPFSTAGSAIRYVLAGSPLDARGIDPGHVSVRDNGHGLRNAVELYSRVLAVISQLERWDAEVLCGWAAMHSDREIAKRFGGTAQGWSHQRVGRIRKRVVAEVTERLVDLGLVE